MLKDKTVYDLPVQPDDNGGNLTEAYVQELKVVDTVEKLKAFAKRWKNVFLIPAELKDMQCNKFEEQIVSETFDATEALSCIQKNTPKPGMKPQDSWCGHKDGCVGANIKLPFLFLRASWIANSYKVPVDIALLQLQRGISEFGTKPPNVSI